MENIPSPSAKKQIRWPTSWWTGIKTCLYINPYFKVSSLLRRWDNCVIATFRSAVIQILPCFEAWKGTRYLTACADTNYGWPIMTAVLEWYLEDYTVHDKYKNEEYAGKIVRNYNISDLKILQCSPLFRKRGWNFLVEDITKQIMVWWSIGFLTTGTW